MADLARVTGLLHTADSPAARQRAIAELAREFEAMLLHELVKQMRETAPEPGEGEDSLFDADALLDTIDSELSRQLARQGGSGLAESLVPRSEPERSGASHAETPPAENPRRALVEPGVASLNDELVLHRPAFRVSSRYGWRQDPFSDRPRFHAGIDMAAPAGQPVAVAARGRVVFAGRQGGYGLTVVVEHEPGVQTRYAHLSEVAVKAEEVVSSDQIIGRVGSTGRSTAPHLHFEVLREGTAVNPMVASRAYTSIKGNMGDADYRSDRASAPVAGGLDNED